MSPTVREALKALEDCVANICGENEQGDPREGDRLEKTLPDLRQTVVAAIAAEERAQSEALRALVKEWQEARTALKGKPVARPFADSALVKNLRDAEAALAALDLGGAE